VGRSGEAVEQYDRALSAQPGFIDAAISRAAALCAMDRPSEALEGLEPLAGREPGNLFVHYNRSVALAMLERFEEAVLACDAALAVDPNCADAWHNRGVSLFRLQRFAEAVESYDRAIGLASGAAELHINRGGALAALARYPEALAAYDRALALDPNSAYAHFNRGVALTEIKRIEDAIVSYGSALRLAPDYALAEYNRALCLLLLGRLEEGFQGYEARHRLTPQPALYPQPLRPGEDIAGKTLLVRGEQGLGDIIQFSRYIRLLQDKGAKVILSVQPHLVRLLSSLAPKAEIIAWTDVPMAFDHHIALESLPGFFRTRLDTIPASIPYLAAEPARVEKWKQRLGQGDFKERGFKIGIAWRSSAGGASIGKTFSPTHFAALSKTPGVRLISLQKDEETAELNDLPSGLTIEQLGPDFDAEADAFVDSAAVMASLDLVISADTGIAHLAGALGRPVWVALKHVPDWRWLLDRADTPWYPTMRLFRQPARGDWPGVFAEMATALREIDALKG
ncbi:MAG TPA: tetratricopeptide repeat-containing glycosyltransferase family protein, partial [Rhizomicrobium sp.]|nr:tetratricopeptide repeat-containing glycosyltransferase family protein [Rhizomicrobium sp.]